MRFMLRLFIGALVFAAIGCGDRRDVYRQELEVLGPFEYPTGLAFLNRTTSQLIRLRYDGDRIKVESTDLARPGAWRVVPVVDGTRLAVLHDDSASPGVSVLDRDPAADTVDPFLPLVDAFDALAVSPSSRFGVAYFTGARTGHTGIRNLNQIQLVDFAERRVQPALALETGGLNPRGVDFVPAGSPAFEDVAVIRVDNGLVLVDPHAPGASPLWVRFTNSPGGVAVPAEVAFGPFYGDGGYLYVRLEGSSDVLSIHVTRDPDGALRRTVNFLNTPAGATPSDLLVLSDSRYADKVFVVYGGSAVRGAALLDANAIQTDERSFSFEIPVQRARPLIGVGPEGTREFVLVYAPSLSGAGPQAYLVDPADGSVEDVFLQDGYSLVDGPVTGSHAMFFHQRMGAAGEPGMRVVRATQPAGSSRWTYRISTFGLQSVPDLHAFDEGGEGMLGSLSGGKAVFLLDLVTGWYATLELDRPAAAMGVIPGTDVAWFQHAHPLGSLTLVSLSDYRRTAAVTVEGFALTGLLEPGSR